MLGVKPLEVQVDPNSSFKAVSNNKILFPNLNGVRFIAALMVIVQHTEEAKIKIGFPTSYRKDFAPGTLGVSLFFVLSGFLITYLLQSEKLSSGTISLRDFYTRRVLRIWPLYYLIIFLGVWVIPNYVPILLNEFDMVNLSSESTTRLLLDLFFLPNIAAFLFTPIPFVYQIWSIGVEEQFYVIWPLLVKYTNNLLKPLIAVILTLVGFNLLATFIYTSLQQKAGTSPDLLKILYFGIKFTALTRIDCMAVGGVGAWILFNKKQNILNILYSRPVQVATYVSVILFISKGMTFGCLYHFPHSILFTIILLNLSSNKLSVVNFNNKFFNYMGKISYGIYMFHPIAIAISFRLVLKEYLPGTQIDYNNTLHFITNATLYLLVMCIVTVISTCSYYCFEKYFLAKKIKFSKILSGDSVDMGDNHLSSVISDISDVRTAKS